MPLQPIKPSKKTDQPIQPKVDYVRAEVTALLPRWTIIRDVLGGQLEVKAKGTEYLVMPNADDKSPENLAEFQCRLNRAVFYNVTARTHAGYVGQVYAKDPSVELPATMQMFIDNVDGSGVQLDQQSKLAFGWALSLGRAGLLTDYPNQVGEDGVPKQTTVADLRSGNIRPTINLYRPEAIINWRTKVIGSVTVLSLVVLVEEYLAEDDGFEPKFKPQWRVLRLDEDSGFYTIEVFRKNEDGFVSEGAVTPLDGSGKPFDRIPFTFIGSEDNSPDPDEPPLLDLALLNLAHYNNSADNEDSVYKVGMPMFWFAGLSEGWVKKVLNGKVRVGSSQAVLLPEGGSAGIVQAEPNSMAFTNMEHKEKQMVALGAKLVEVKTVQRTATEAGIAEASETSILMSCARNVSQAYRAAFKFVGLFLGTDVSDDALAYELNTDIAIARLDTAGQQALMAMWQSGAMDFEEMRWNLRRSSLVYKDDDEVKESIDAELIQKTAMQQLVEPDPADDPDADPNA
jgi:hypothetical protein